MSKKIKNLLDPVRSDSLPTLFRKKRIKIFKKAVQSLSKPLKIIDVGGREHFWQNTGLANISDYQITLINLSPIRPKSSNIKAKVGDARNLKNIKDQQFDIAFSNATIEHVGPFKDQQKMAGEIMRVAKYYFVQTPNYYFPLEQHYIFPFYQFFPLSIKLFLLQNFNLPGKKRIKNRHEALEQIKSINLLTPNQLKKLFPKGRLYREKFLGLTKTLIITNIGSKKSR